MSFLSLAHRGQILSVAIQHRGERLSPDDELGKLVCMKRQRGEKKKRVSLGKCFELVVCKTVLLGLFLWGGGLETYSRQVLLVRAFAHFADTRVVLKVEKSELLAFCLLPLL